MSRAPKADDRFTAICVPGDGDEPAVWFVFDRIAKRSVRRARDFDDARAKARKLNAGEKEPRRVDFRYE